MRIENIKPLIVYGIILWIVFAGLLWISKTEAIETELNKKYNLSTEIKTKYQLDNGSLVKVDIKNAELDKYKNEPKDEIKIILGDKDKMEFAPNIELKRWNEVSFKIKTDNLLSGVATKDKDLKFEGDKIKFATPKISFEMYDFTEGEGGFKYIWYLNEPPANNKIEFEIETSGLEFFYQPELTPEEIAEGAERPENVVGSYAVYHSTKGGMNDVNGKDYKVGKAFHIYRPHIIDANGAETWGILHIENGIYSVEIPQEFLDKAVYPIKSNDTFGYTSQGGSSTYTIENFLNGGVYTGALGTGTSITAFLTGIGTTQSYKFALYQNSDSALVANGTTGSATYDGAGNINGYTLNFTTSPNLTVQDYVIVAWGNAGTGTVLLSSDSITGQTRKYQSLTYGTWPNPATFSTTADIRQSIYATYTPSGGGPTNPAGTLKVLNGKLNAFSNLWIR